MNDENSRPTTEERVAYIEGRLGVLPPWRPFCDDPIRTTVVERVAYLDGLLWTKVGGE